MERAKCLAVLAAALATTCVPPTNATRTQGPWTPALDLTASREVEAFAPAPLPGPATGAPAATTPVVLVVLDGVRWQEIFGGVDPALAARHRVGPVVDARALMPALYSAMDARGAAMGAPGRGTIAASGPNFVSLPGYTEIFSGHAPTACADNQCAGARGPTLVDAFRDRASSDAGVAVIASWPPIGRAATTEPERIVLSTGRSLVSNAGLLASDRAARDALDAGSRADPYPGHDGFRPDRFTGALALAFLRARQPDFLFVGLGEPDEYAHADDYAGYLGSLRAADAFFGRLFGALDEMGDRGRDTLVLVTADHGRSRDCRDHGGGLPESARVWLFAIGGPVRARGMVPASNPHRLSDIAPTIRQISGLPPPTEGDSLSGDSLRGNPMTELFAAPAANLVAAPASSLERGENPLDQASVASRAASLIRRE